MHYVDRKIFIQLSNAIATKVGDNNCLMITSVLLGCTAEQRRAAVECLDHYDPEIIFHDLVAIAQHDHNYTPQCSEILQHSTPVKIIRKSR